MIGSSPGKKGMSTRRDLLQLATFAPLATLLPANAYTVTGPDDGNLKDLPSEAQRSYLQYRVPLQTATDFYVFELQKLLDEPSEWGEVGQLFRSSNANGQSNPSRIEREFTNVMRIVGLSMPPDAADEMREAQYRFEGAMYVISKATAGIRRDLPVEVDDKSIDIAKKNWEEGRQALNQFLVVLNDTTGLNEMRTIPPAGPDQFKEYGRSERKYTELKKKLKLCQNRGGPTLANTWGQLMVAGTVSEYCGIPDLNDYFYQ